MTRSVPGKCRGDKRHALYEAGPTNIVPCSRCPLVNQDQESPAYCKETRNSDMFDEDEFVEVAGRLWVTSTRQAIGTFGCATAISGHSPMVFAWRFRWQPISAYGIFLPKRWLRLRATNGIRAVCLGRHQRVSASTHQQPLDLLPQRLRG